MEIRFSFKKECYSFDFYRFLVFSLVATAMLILLRLCGADTSVCRLLLMPSFALNGVAFFVLWHFFSVLLAFVLELLVSQRRNFWRERAFFLLISVMVLGYLWFALFFALKAFFLSFALSLFIVFLSLLALKAFAKVTRLAFWLFFSYLVWLIYASSVGFCVMILN